MSGQFGQAGPARGPKSSPSSGKLGPLKATIPMSSVLKPNCNLRPDSSPTFVWKNMSSPDHSSGQRSPGSTACKGKPKNQNIQNHIRRTASLDAIYLKGHWPKGYYWFSENFQLNKATQTEEEDWPDAKKVQSLGETSDSKLDKVVRHIKRSSRESSRHGSPGENTLDNSSQTLNAWVLPPALKAIPVNIPMKLSQKSNIRSSVEGLNQEIETIVQKTSVEAQNSVRDEEYDKFFQITPEGHRAPLAEMFRTGRSRSVNTQTPQDFGSCSSSGPSSRDSFSPQLRRFLDSPLSDAGDSHGSSPDQSCKLGTSPHINKFLAREPPDGCEKVFSKSLDDRKFVPLETAPQPSNFKLKPSSGSAFQILQPNLSGVDENIPIVPSIPDFN